VITDKDGFRFLSNLLLLIGVAKVITAVPQNPTGRAMKPLNRHLLGDLVIPSHRPPRPTIDTCIHLLTSNNVFFLLKVLAVDRCCPGDHGGTSNFRGVVDEAPRSSFSLARLGRRR